MTIAAPRLAQLTWRPWLRTALTVALLCTRLVEADEGNDADALGVDIAVSALGYSDGLPLRTAYDGFDGVAPRKSEEMYARQRAELGASRGPWRVAVGYRHDYLAHYSDDALQLLYGRHNDLPAAPGNYRLRAEVTHTEAFGLALSRGFSLGPVDALLRIDLLRAHEFTDGRLDGRLQVATTGELTADARLDSHYSKDDVLQRPKQEHRPGWGASLSLAASYRPAPNWQISLRVDDALSAIRFADAPYTRAQLRLAAPRLAADGTIDSEALLRGREAAHAHWQTLPAHYDLRLDYALSASASSYARLRGTARTALPELGFSWGAQGIGRWQIGWLPTARAVTLGISSRGTGGRLSIATDQLDADRARLLELDLAAAWHRAD